MSLQSLRNLLLRSMLSIMVALLSAAKSSLELCDSNCNCSHERIVCNNITDVELKQFLNEKNEHFWRELIIVNSDLGEDFSLQTGLKLQKLTMSKGDLVKINLEQDNWDNLKELNLSFNCLSNFENIVGLEKLKNLEVLDLSHNSISNVDFNFLRKLENLNILDLSHNNIKEYFEQNQMQLLPKGLKELRLADNDLSCSAESSSLHSFLSSRPELSLAGARCRYGSSTFTGDLALVSFYYSEHVLPSCPSNCNCSLSFVQERVVLAPSRVYSVDVMCVASNLSELPMLPKHTRRLDLSQNLIDVGAFERLDVGKAHYEEIDFIVLDHNSLEDLPVKLIQLKLELGLSARNNRISEIPYALSQHLLRMNTVLYLAGNPWRCTCQSQITDLSLLAKVADANQLQCGPSSPPPLHGLVISSLSRESLCPPESDEARREQFLRLLCFVLGVLVLLVLTRLAVDTYNYHSKGQVPFIAMKLM